MEVEMDIDTLILMVLLVMALCWWCAIHINEQIQLIKQGNKEEQERLERAERIKNLTNRS